MACHIRTLWEWLHAENHLKIYTKMENFPYFMNTFIIQMPFIQIRAFPLLWLFKFMEQLHI